MSAVQERGPSEKKKRGLSELTWGKYVGRNLKKAKNGPRGSDLHYSEVRQEEVLTEETEKGIQSWWDGGKQGTDGV